MVLLVEWHTPNDPMLIADYFPCEKVIVCLAVSGAMGTASIICAVPVFLVRKFAPALWLLPLLFGMLMFLNWYDWDGLFQYGKPWSAVPTR
jgi:hypothetical protein